MARMRLTALAVLISAIVTGVCVADYIGAVFALSVLLLYALIWLILPFSLIGVGIKLDPMPDVIKDGALSLKLTLTRKYPIPCGGVRVKLAFKNEYNGETSFEDVFIRLPKKETESVAQLSLAHSGKMSVKVRRLWVYDMLGLIALPLFKKDKAEFFVLPALSETQISGILPQETDDGRVTDPNKAGNARPELFGVHEYVPGDALRDVHWKLSARMDKMMVREYVRPLGYDAGILCINGTDTISNEKADKLIEAFASLSLSLVKSGIPHYASWIENGVIRREKILTEEDAFASVRAVLSVPLALSETLCAALYGAKTVEARRIIVAAEEDENVLNTLSLYANDMLVFIGEDIPAALSGRINAFAAVSENGGDVNAAFSLMFSQGVRI